LAEPDDVAGPRAWVAFALMLGFGAGLGWAVPHEAVDWQPGPAGVQPWRAFSAVFVHYSVLHLVANLAGAALVAGVGHAAQVPLRCAVAWLAAWPLTQVGLLLQPGLLHYGGVSGVLHAGVAIVGVHLVWRGAPRQRRIGAAILVVLLGKVLGETPWNGPLRHPAGWDIAVAPLAHASGLVMGVLCAVIAEATARRTYHRRS
jgi:rhomboid family GlyGly-CTERM serine protease